MGAMDGAGSVAPPVSLCAKPRSEEPSIKAHAGLHEPPLHDDQMQGCVAIPERKERRKYKDTRPEAVFRRMAVDSGSCSVM